MDADDVYRALPVAMAEALLSQTVTDVMAVDDGTGWIKSFGRMDCVGHVLPYVPEFLCLAAAASSTGEMINEEFPELECSLPRGERLVGKRPPRGAWSFTIRRPVGRRLSWRDLIDSGSVTERQADWITAQIRQGKRGFVSGEMGSGKTTLLNTIIGDQEFATRKTVLFEAVEELIPPPVSVRYLISRKLLASEAREKALRESASVFIVGEARSGREMAEVLSAMSTGHQSFSTIHANSLDEIPMRIEDMLRQVGDARTSEQIAATVARSVDFLLHMKEMPDGRRVLSDVATFGVEGRKTTINRVAGLTLA